MVTQFFGRTGGWGRQKSYRSSTDVTGLRSSHSNVPDTFLCFMSVHPSTTVLVPGVPLCQIQFIAIFYAFRRQIYKIHISYSLLVSYHNMSLKIYLGLSICLFYVFHMHPIYCPLLCVRTLALLLWATRWSSALTNKSGCCCCCCGGGGGAGSSRRPCGLRC